MATHVAAQDQGQSEGLPDFLLDDLNDLSLDSDTGGQSTPLANTNSGDVPTFLNDLPSIPASSLGVDPKSQEDLRNEAREEAFDAALQGLLPLKPTEIRRLLEHFDRTQEAVELPVYPAPRPEVAVETISLDPGTRPSVVKTAYGHVSTLSILDRTGQPWPIQDISWAGNFEIINGSEEGAHIIRVSPQSEFARGNISMRLLDLQTPVILSIETSRDEVHYRFDAIIAEVGPRGNVPLINRGVGLQAGSASISSFLQGVPPGDAERLNVSGVDGRTSAYRLNDRVYVRTPLTLLSPGWSASVASADGMQVYELPDTPVILVSQDGKMKRVRLSNRGSLSDLAEQ